MKLEITPGKYVVAVSGGVDSMVLLDVLAHMPDLVLVVAHFDHGIRQDSLEDLRLVRSTATRHNLAFVYAHGALGPQASEAVARSARYAFLRSAAAEHGAQAIITAHHQDDMLETAAINMLRGTGRRGLSSLRSSGDVLRPLLNISKKELREYARQHNVQWREDSTNRDDRYLRNYLRLRILPRMNQEQRRQLLQAIHTADELNTRIDTLLHEHIHGTTLNRRWFIMLPHIVSAEAMAAWLRRNQAAFDRNAIERLVVFAKTAAPGKRADVDKHWQLVVSKEHITLLAK